MKALIRFVLIVLILGGIGLYVISRLNNTSLTPQTIDLSVDCSEVDNALIMSTVTVVVKNLSSRPHEDVTVKVTGYDKGDKVTKEKFTTFSRTLLPNSTFDKPVTLPAATKRCECTIVSSH